LRKLVEDALTASEALQLAGDIGYHDFGDPLITGLVDKVQGLANISTEKPAYCRVEHRLEGCPWHRDTGTGSHMAWCKFSAGVVLTPQSEYTGGGFYFRDQPETALHHYRDLIIYDDAVENEHTVARHRGNRRTLLMFFVEGV
jgi:hypothetical protein|tara:strand:+ start:12711 stop:13139 length:429 start_codon:yes stop_codon:yes gene_type:complete